MKARYFNSIMPRLNEDWSARNLGMEVQYFGPDLINEERNTIVEVKFTLIGKKCGADKYPINWIVDKNQLSYCNGHDAYWALGTYSLDRLIKKIRKEDTIKLEKMVLGRELWIVPWEFMGKYTPNFTSGETKISQWEAYLMYPKLKDIPKPIKTYHVEKGLIHLTEGVNQEHFNLI